jgi:hypothetical protein
MRNGCGRRNACGSAAAGLRPLERQREPPHDRREQLARGALAVVEGGQHRREPTAK